MKLISLKSVISHQASALRSDQTIAKALEMMADLSISSIVIVDEESRPIGIFTEHDALRVVADTINMERCLHEVMSTDPFCVEEMLYLHDAYAVMEEKGYRHLVVVNEAGRFAGVVSEGDFLRHIGFEQLGKFKVVSEAMSGSPLIVSLETPLFEAAGLMRDRKSEYAVVLEGSHPVGLVTERDIAYWYAQEKGSAEVTVEKLLHRDFRIIHKEIPLQEAAALMEKHGIHQLLVVDEGDNLVGLLNRHDVLHAVHGAYFEFLIRVIDQKNETITKMSKWKKELVHRTSFLETLVGAIPDLVWLKDTNGSYLACNPMFERFIGVKESDLIGRTDFDFVSAERAQFFRENDLTAIAEGGTRNSAEFLKFADGSHEGIFDTIKTPMRDGDGQVLGVLGIARDITQRSEHEAVLLRKDNDLAAAQALAHIGSWRLDVRQNLLQWSDETYRIFGIEIGAPITYEVFLSVIHPEDVMKVDSAWQAALSGSEYEIEHRIVVNGELKWVREHAQLEIDREGNLLAGLGSVQLITERKLYEERLETLANYDPLTGLANRMLLLSHLQNSLTQAKRDKTQIALLMFDLDRFKDINDSYGHSAGDELLRAVAERFTSRLREGDLISRLGGDEFAIVLENLAHPEDAGRLAEEMIRVLGSEYKLISGASIHVGASAGIVLFPDHGDAASTLLQHADAALYKAKSEGRGTYHYYTDELTDSARKRIECEMRLRRAVANGEFEVYYQPQVHIQTGRIVGAEALIRWNDPERGIISPVLFIPIAEETGLIGDIGEWVLNETCRQGKIWLDGGHRLTLAVNLSAHQVRHQNIPLMVEHALKKSGYPADRLELELTESALMQREEETVAMLHTLRAMGIRLAIDDFGTGYSSLSYLKRFPIDVLKIDKSFVDDIPYERDDMAIVTAIIAMGQALGFQILAEGTERIEQIEFLREKGCTMYQGFFKSPPVPAAEFEKLLV